MNKELIRKYKTEFDHWLKGRKIQVYYKKDDEPKWWTDEDSINYDGDDNFSHILQNPLEPDDVLIVIDDEYVEFRKAMAEGKIVQEQDYFNKKWIDMKTDDFHGASYERYEGVYRIKPEEPKFKVGDWITDGIEVWRHKENCRVKNQTSWRLWQPKPGEWCWFWNDSFDVPILAKLISIDSVFDRPLEYKVKTPSCISETSYNYMSNMSFKKCEPFIGQLPSNLRVDDGI